MFLSIQQLLGVQSPTSAWRRPSWSPVWPWAVGARLCRGREGRGSKAGSSLCSWHGDTGAGAGGAAWRGSGKREPWAVCVRAGERVAALVAPFPRAVPSSLTTSVTACGSTVPRGCRRRRWQRSRGPHVPWGTECCSSSAAGQGAGGLCCSGRGCAVTQGLALLAPRDCSGDRSPRHPCTSPPGA